MTGKAMIVHMDFTMKTSCCRYNVVRRFRIMTNDSHEHIYHSHNAVEQCAVLRVPASDSTAMILWIWMISTCPSMLDRYSLFVWLFIEQRNRSRNNPMGLSATWAHAFMQTRKTSDRRRYGFDITENHRFRTPSYTSMMTEPTPQEHSFREKHARQQQCEQWPHTMHA